MNVITILKKLISFDSQSQKTNLPIVKYIASLFPPAYSKITLVRKNPDIYNLAVKFPGKTVGRALVFSGHTDTVPVSSGWTRAPFNPVISGDKIFGLGSCDMKAGLAAMIVAAQSIKQPPARDVWFLFDADEEVSGIGGKRFIKDLSFKNGADVIIAEPTGCKLIMGQKGGIDLKVSLSGQAFHSSRTSRQKNLQYNAIHKAALVIAALQKLESKLSKKKDRLFGEPTLAVCMISGGTATNVIPDSCELTVNRRLLPNENAVQAIAEIKKYIYSVVPKAQIQVDFVGAPNLINPKGNLFMSAKKTMEAVTGEYEQDIFTGWTQAGLFNLWGDCLVWGPGEMKTAHQANEYCSLTQLEVMACAYTHLVLSI